MQGSNLRGAGATVRMPNTSDSRSTPKSTPRANGRAAGVLVPDSIRKTPSGHPTAAHRARGSKLWQKSTSMKWSKRSLQIEDDTPAPISRSYTQRVLAVPLRSDTTSPKHVGSDKRKRTFLLDVEASSMKYNRNMSTVGGLKESSHLRRLKDENQTILDLHIRINFWTLRFNDATLEAEFRQDQARRYYRKFQVAIVLLSLIHLVLGIVAVQCLGTSVPHQAAFVANVLSLLFGAVLLRNLEAIMSHTWAYVAAVYLCGAFALLQRLFYGSNGVGSAITFSAGNNDLGFAFATIFVVTYFSGITFVEGALVCIAHWSALGVVMLTSPEARLVRQDSHSAAMCEHASLDNQLETLGWMCVFCWLLILVMRMYESQARKMFRLTRRLAAENINVQMEMTTMNAFSKGAASVAPDGENSNEHVKDLIATIIDTTEIGTLELIGSGSFGQVFHSTWKGMDIAAKRLHDDVDEEELAQFGVELATMSKLRHPNIVMFLGFSLLPPMIVMEFMPRGSLDDLLHVKDTRMDTSICLRFLLDITKGLNFLHLNNPAVLHLDLKPANILIDPDWRLKLSDFGLSELHKDSINSGSVTNGESMRSLLPVAPEDDLEEEDLDNDNDSSLNNTTSSLDAAVEAPPPKAPPTNVCGSLQWAAPEIISGETNASESCDIYSMGVVFFELLTRKRPYVGLVPESIPLQVLRGKRPDDYVDVKAACVNHTNSQVVKEWCKLAKSCWSELPSDRPSCSDIVPMIHEMITTYFGSDHADWQDKIVFPGQVLPMRAASANKARRSSGITASLRHKFTIDASHLTVGRRIGGGTYGEVFQGEYFGTKVAVKQLFTNAVPEAVQDEFNRECAIMLQMRHPNLVLFMGSICEPPKLILVTELMEGGSLHSVYLSQSAPDEEVHLPLVRDLAIDMARGLNYLHSSKPSIVHRDMKSPNVLLDRNFKGKIGDFGLSKIKEEGQALTSVGSPLWCAPEILRGEPFGLSCDVYSYGVVVWEALAWMEPYPDISSVHVMQGVAFDELRPTKPKGLPRYFSKVLDCCWRDNPDERPSFAEIIDMLLKSKKAERGALQGTKGSGNKVTRVNNNTESDVETDEEEGDVVTQSTTGGQPKEATRAPEAGSAKTGSA